jgi:hypothetical protein
VYEFLHDAVPNLEVDVVAAPVQQVPSALQQSLRDHFRRDPPAAVLHMSVKTALREHPITAKKAIIAELQQMINMKVWVPVHKWKLTADEIKRIIRSNMICNEKFLPSGLFERIKSRLVAGGHMQDKTLYQDLSSSTVGTSFVYVVAGIAAKEKRIVVTIDIAGAYLHAPLKDDDVVYMHISKSLFEMLIELDNSYANYTCSDGGCVVRLYKALYGTIQAASLWGDNIATVLLDDAFIRNRYELCCYNKTYSDGIQITCVTNTY